MFTCALKYPRIQDFKRKDSNINHQAAAVSFEAREACPLGGSGVMPPHREIVISSLLRLFLMTILWLNSMDDLLQNLALALLDITFL